MRRTAIYLLLAIVSSLSFRAARAQPATPAPAFDVASVKPSPPSGSDLLNINLGTASHGVVTLGNTTLSECIRYSYGLTSEAQVSGPDWIRDRGLRVDIMAKTAPDTPIEQIQRMMQTLLAQRFLLQLHREPRPVAHFDLAVGKNGLKLHESPEGAPAAAPNYGRGRIIYSHIPMRTLTVLLSRQLKQPVIDLTGLPGFYDIHLEWSLDDPQEALQHPAADAPALPDIYKAVQQLGLLLEPKKTPIDVLVIDHAEKVPIAN